MTATINPTTKAPTIAKIIARFDDEGGAGVKTILVATLPSEWSGTLKVTIF
jgi:fatty acid-binding protein DegV